MSGVEGSATPLPRREFLRRAGLIAGASVVAGRGITELPFRSGRSPQLARTSVLDAAAGEARFDTLVVVMMENRSFDHLLGWVGTDAAYLAAGRQRYGTDFTIDGNKSQTDRDVQGQEVATHWLPGTPGEQYQGCGENIPGHGWNAGPVQMNHGFLAQGGGNGPFALGYYEASDMLFTEQLVRRFTTSDRWFSSLLGPTFPNRQFRPRLRPAMDLPAPAAPCTFGAKGAASPGDPFVTSQAMADLQDSRFKEASQRRWSHET
jgi:phospholipase C